MSYERLAYDDAATTTEMLTDAQAVGQELHVPGPRRPAHAAGSLATPEISAELAELAGRLELHLD